MLSADWDHCPGPAAQGKKGSAQGRGWAGRVGAMAALVKYHVEPSSSPSESIAELSECLALSPVMSEEYAGGCLVVLQPAGPWSVPLKREGDIGTVRTPDAL